MVEVPFSISIQATIFILSFVIALLAGLLIVPSLKKLGAGQTVRDDGPSSHLKKTGTPTLGGIIILLPVILISIMFLDDYPGIIAVLLSTTGFGVIGFLDDFLKIARKSKDGLTPRQKMFGLLFVATAFSIYAAYFSPAETDIVIPFRGLESTFTIPVWLFIPFSVFVMIAATNSVNLTDGVDGLAASVTIVVLVFFTIVAMMWDEWDYIKVFSASVAGGCLGFLAYNIHPAKVFMGDTGSLALGGALASIAILLGMPWILVISGIVYVVEAVSDIIQVVYFKLTGRRFFRMAPIHHHFELSGWSEGRVVCVFTIVTLLFCVVGFASLRIGIF